MENRYIENCLEKAKSTSFPTSWYSIISEVLGILIFLSGLTVLVGWILDIPVLKSISPNFVAMKANTAICFILIGLSLWLLQTKRQGNRIAGSIVRLCSFAVFTIGFLTFWEYMLGCNLGIDQFLFEESADAILTSSPGRMAFNTSINFTIIGMALLLCGFETVFFYYLAQLLVIPSGIVALLSFVGYLYGASPLIIGLNFSTAMALHTCVLFIMSCMGCLFVRPEQGLMKDVSSDNYGSLMLRRILPVVIVIPLVLGWFKIHGEKTGLFRNEFSVSFVAVCNLLMVSLSVYILSVYLNRLDAKRKQTEAALQIEKDNLTEEIAEHRQTEESLRASQQIIEGIINAIPVRVFWKDKNLVFLGCNAIFARDAGFTDSKDIIGKNDYQMQWSDRAELYRGDDRQVIESGCPKFLIEEPQTTPEGKTITLLTSKMPLRNSNGDISGVLGIYIDITERKQMEDDLRLAKANAEATVEKLTAANIDISDFAHVAAHDLKAPLRAIGSLAGIIKNDCGDKLDEQHRQYLDALVSRTERMSSLISGLLRYSEIGRGEHKKEMTDLNLCVREAIANMAVPENIEITMDDQLPVVMCEKIRIVQVFQNLIDNAIKYMDKPQGQITIGCIEKDDFWKFSVSDNGPGIAKEYFDKIFQIFQMLTRRDEKESTGIGLSLVKKIIETNGGKVWVESKPGEGSTFFFTLAKQEARVENAELQTNTIS